MRNLFNFLVLFLIGVLETQDAYGRMKAHNCLVPYQEQTKNICMGYIPRYYYDREDDACVLFVYGGCGGGPNNFVSKEECEKECDVHEVDATNAAAQEHMEFIDLEYNDSSDDDED